MVAASFADTFQPFTISKQEQSFTPETVAKLLNPTAGMGGGRSLRETRQQLKAYTHWNYVAINRICTKVSEQAPMVSLKVSGNRQNLSLHDRDHLRQHYGGVLQSMREDLEPLSGNHPLCELLQRINSVDWWQSFAYETHLFWQLTGEFYWWVIPNGIGLPAELWVVPPDMVEPEWGDNGVLKFWKLRSGNHELEVPADQILHCWFKSPLSKTGGYSPNIAGANWIANSESIEESRHYAFQNSINPSLLLKLGEKFGSPDVEVINRIKEKVASRMSGIRRTGEPMVIPPNIEVEKAAMSPKELDFGVSGDAVRDQVLALRGVHKVIAGISDDVNRSTIEGANVIFCETTINPLLSWLAGFMTEMLARRYDPRIVIWFQDCKPRNAEQELQEDRLDLEHGAMSPDERRVKRGREPVGSSAYQTGYIAGGRVAVSDMLEEAEPEDKEGDEDDE